MNYRYIDLRTCTMISQDSRQKVEFLCFLTVALQINLSWLEGPVWREIKKSKRKRRKTKRRTEAGINVTIKSNYK